MIKEDRECGRNIVKSETNILTPTSAPVAATRLLGRVAQWQKCRSIIASTRSDRLFRFGHTHLVLGSRASWPWRRAATAAYPSSHFAADRTAHGFRGGMSYAKR